MKFGKSKDRLNIDEKTTVEKSVYFPPDSPPVEEDKSSPPVMKVFNPRVGTIRNVSSGGLR
jgi:hypothetical protein